MSIPELRKVDSGVYYAFWTDNRRSRRKSMGTSDAAVAEQRFAQWLLLGGHRGQVAAPGEGPALTIAELWLVYDQKHVQNPDKVVSSTSITAIWKNLQVHFGRMTVDQVDEDAVTDYREKREAGKIGLRSKGSTVRKELAMLRACLNWHADPERGKRRLVDPKDINVFTLPAEGRPRERWLRHEEIQRLLTAAGELRNGPRLSRGERFLWIALETAARKQAILELTWDRVDFETNVIHLQDPERRVTKKRRATVPISKALRPVLVRAFEERTGNLVLDSKRDVWATIQVIAERAGFSSGRPRKDGKPVSTGISPHVLRHTAATHMARRGVSLWVIAKVLGNTLTMVEKVYSHHSPDDLRAAVDTISGGVLSAAE